MLAKRLILSLLIVISLSILFVYFYHSSSLLIGKKEAAVNIDLYTEEIETERSPFHEQSLTVPDEISRSEEQSPSANSSSIADTLSTNSKRIEIFGRVVDEYNQGIENVLISEDRYLFSARSDTNGQYRLVVILPRHKFPLLNFLRSGYQGDRVGISTDQLDDNSMAELNVSLIKSLDSVKIEGWISNEFGESLSGQKIHISSWGYQGQETIFYSALSDDKGEFVFEGVKPDVDYKLAVDSTPEYARYLVEGLSITRTPPRLNIILKALNYIEVNGMFVNNQGTPIANFEININNLTTGTHIQKIVSDSSGFFSVKKFPAGEMKFTSKAPEYFTINGLTLLENDYKNLVIVVDRGNYQLSGWVSDQNGVAVERAMVTLDAEIKRGGIQSISRRSSVTDGTGKFRFEGLSDVEHVISVYARGFYKNVQSHRFQSPSSEIYIPLSRP